ncbi:MAG TPA: hypothetical protein VFB44_05520 [Thermoleophilaceae bacterium]|nr:hypothetical protein [Thermoleophilaceae bacterium]
MSTATDTPRSAPGEAAGAGHERQSRNVWGPAALVLAFAIVLWLIFGVSVGQILRYLAYQAAFVAVPGVLAYMAFARAGRVGLRELALGWPLGYALELAAFALTAALGARGLFWAYPPVVIALSGGVLLARRRRRERAAEPREDYDGSRYWGWGLAVLVGVLMVYVAERYFTLTPLPAELTGPVSYAQDYVWQLSLAAEALNHWPLTLPNAAGLDLHYHYFAYLHMAAVSQVTDLELGVVNFRLWVFPVLALVCLQLVAIGRSIGAGSWAGIVGAGLVLLVGAFDPWPRPPSEFFTHIYESASYGFGLLFFLPMALLVGEQLGARQGLGDPRRWVLVGVFAAAASGSKSTILPVCFLGIALVGAAALWLERGRPLGERVLLGRALVAGAVIGLCALVSRLVLYPGASGEIEVRLLNDVARLNPASWINSELGLTGVPKAVVVALSAVLETAKLLAPLALGLWVLIRARGRRLGAAELWLLALLGASLIAYYTLFHPSDSDVYFLYYGYVAAGVAAGAGMVLLARRHLSNVRVSVAAAAVVCALVLAVWATDGPPGAYEGQNTPQTFYRYALGEVTWAQDNSNLTPGLYTGLRWVADNTSDDAVLAVNNRWQDAAGYDPRYCYWTGFAERRALLECEYGTELNGEFAPLPALQADPAAAGALSDRARLEYEMFYGDDGVARTAAREAAQRYGVTHAALDLVHPFGATPESVARLGPVVFQNDSLVVVRLDDAAGA